MPGLLWQTSLAREQFQRQALPRFCPNCSALFPDRTRAKPAPCAEMASHHLGADQPMELEMNRARYRVVQDFLHIVMMGVVTGVLFSMALTGLVFLVSGQAHA